MKTVYTNGTPQKRAITDQIILIEPGVSATAVAYEDTVIGYSPIAYWMLDEASGSTAVCQINALQNGTYYGATLGEPALVTGYTSAYFPGGDAGGPDESSVDVYSSTLNDAFDGNTGSLAGWFKWDGDITDGEHQRLLYLRAIDGANNRYIVVTVDGSTQALISWAYPTWSENLDLLASVDTDAHHVAVTWGASGAVGYLDGAEVDTSPGSQGWTGNLHYPNCALASDYTDGDSAVNFTGWLAHWALWDVELSAADVAVLAAG